MQCTSRCCPAQIFTFFGFRCGGSQHDNCSRQTIDVCLTDCLTDCCRVVVVIVEITNDMLDATRRKQGVFAARQAIFSLSGLIPAFKLKAHVSAGTDTIFQNSKKYFFGCFPFQVVGMFLDVLII